MTTFQMVSLRKQGEKIRAVLVVNHPQCVKTLLFLSAAGRNLSKYVAKCIAKPEKGEKQNFY